MKLGHHVDRTPFFHVFLLKRHVVFGSPESRDPHDTQASSVNHGCIVT